MLLVFCMDAILHKHYAYLKKLPATVRGVWIGKGSQINYLAENQARKWEG